IVEPAHHAADLPPGGAGSVAGGESPADIAVPGKAAWVPDGVLPLDVHRAPAVLEVVEPALPHVPILDPAEVHPDVRQVVNEERAGVDVLDPVDPLPAVGREPGVVRLGRDRKRGGAE